MVQLTNTNCMTAGPAGGPPHTQPVVHWEA